MLAFVDVILYIMRNSIGQVQFLTDSAPFVLFMTRPTGFEEGVKSSNKQMDTRDANDTITMYNLLFNDVMGITLSDKYEAQVTALRDFLIASEAKLKVLAESTRSIAHAFHNIAVGMYLLRSSIVSLVAQ
jgi:hypothetical protein